MKSYMSFFRKLRKAEDIYQLSDALSETLLSQNICEYIKIAYYNFYTHKWQKVREHPTEFSSNTANHKFIRRKQFFSPDNIPFLNIYIGKTTLPTRKEKALLKEYLETYRICFSNFLLKEQITVHYLELRRYQTLLDSIKEGIVIADINDNMYYLNTAIRSMMGLENEEIHNFSQLKGSIFDAAAWDEVQAQLRLRAQGQTTTYKVKTINKKGELKYLSIRGMPLKDHEDVPLVFLAVIRDITDEELIKIDLEKSQQEADQARAAERLFLANMSHEIRTPINAVIGMIHLLLQTHPTPEQLEYLQGIKFSADTLLQLVTNILDISKIEASELHLEKTTFSLNNLLLTLQQFYQQQIRTQKAISIIVCTDENIQQQIIGDSIRLHQVLANLITNACKFTDNGTVGINVKLLAETAKDYTIEISIRDSGIGIAPENIDRIFHSFKQSSQQSYRKFGGTGLGLAIVKQLVELQGGSIRVESTLGKGTTFFIVITFEKSELAEINLETLLNDTQIPNIQIENRDNNLSSLNILVAEDNELNQKLMSRLLDNWRAKATFVSNGQLALDALQNKAQTFDLILMDIHMPLLDGYQTTEAIRNLEDDELKNIPIIALTAAALVEEKQKAMQIGMNDFLTKPFNPQQLYQLLTQYKKSHSEKTTHTAQEALITMFDLTYLSNLCGNDTNFISEILQNFLNESPKDLAQLQQLLDSQNIDGTTALLHKVKSTYSLVGFQYLNEKASNIESNIKKEGFIPQHIQSLQALIHEIPNTYPILEQWLLENNL